jgi:hypothetical protein
MKEKLIIILLLNILCSLIVLGQVSPQKEIEGFWIQHPGNSAKTNTDETIYMYYSKQFATMVWFYQDAEIDHYTRNYGFYDDCDLPAMDSLKRNGNYYFEVTPFDFEREDKRKVYVESACGQVSFFTEKQDTFMNIYYSSRQQYVTYKKLDALPQNIQNYLLKKGVHVGSPHKEISSAKAPIYSEPEKPTKMYLIKGDVVTVLEEKNGWLKVEYEGKKLVTGWIKKGDTEQ